MVVAELLRAEQLEEVALHVRLHEVQILQGRKERLRKCYARQKPKKVGYTLATPAMVLFDTPGKLDFGVEDTSPRSQISSLHIKRARNFEDSMQNGIEFEGLLVGLDFNTG